MIGYITILDIYDSPAIKIDWQYTKKVARYSANSKYYILFLFEPRDLWIRMLIRMRNLSMSSAPHSSSASTSTEQRDPPPGSPPSRVSSLGSSRDSSIVSSSPPSRLSSIDINGGGTGTGDSPGSPSSVFASPLSPPPQPASAPVREFQMIPTLFDIFSKEFLTQSSSSHSASHSASRHQSASDLKSSQQSQQQREHSHSPGKGSYCWMYM